MSHEPAHPAHRSKSRTLPIFGVMLIMCIVSFTIGKAVGVRETTYEVGVMTQELLLHNCLSFNNELEKLGKPERMDCSMFTREFTDSLGLTT